MHVRHFFPMDAGGGSPGGVADAAAVDAAAATAAAGADAASAGTPGADAAPGGGTAGTGSLLARGSSGSQGGGAQPATADAGADDKPAAIPEKYVVKNEDGTTNHEATALKVAQGYAALSKRLGAGEAPPAKPEDYAPAVPAGIKIDELKQDPLYTGFLKGAHARGMNNAQVSYVLEAMAQRMAPNPAAAEAELREVWKDDATLTKHLGLAYRAASTYAGDLLPKVEAKFGSDPDFIKLMAKIGGELGEDPGVNTGITPAEQETMESLMTSPAYLDGKHPEHAKTVARVRTLYERKFAGQ